MSPEPQPIPPPDERPLSLLERLYEVQKELQPVLKSGTRKDRSGNRIEYTYVSHDDVIAALKPLLHKHGVLAISSAVKQDIGWSEVRTASNEGERVRHLCIATVQERIAFHAPDTGEEMAVDSYGSAAGYEATVVGVARSYAKKYGLLNFFLAEQGDEVDAERLGETSAEGERVSTPPMSMPAARAFVEGDDAKVAELAVVSDEKVASLKQGWHTRGAVSRPQINRLFAIAKHNGWETAQVKAVIHAATGKTVDELPWGKPYNNAVALFEAYRPEQLLP